MSQLEEAYGIVNQIGAMRFTYLGHTIQKLPITDLFYVVKRGTEGEEEEYVCAEIDLLSAMDRIEMMKD